MKVMAPDKPILGIVIPCYDEELVIKETAEKLLAILESLIFNAIIDKTSFIYFVDDGSQDKTWDIILKLHETNPIIRGVKLSKNVGHQNALVAGYTKLAGCVDCLISIDADLQQDENAIPLFIDKYKKGADIVYGVRNNRKTDKMFKKISASIFYDLISYMGVKLIKNHADYRLVSSRALKAFLEYKEKNIFLRGIFTDLGFKTDIVYFDVRDRFAGKTKYTLKKMVSLCLDGITSFSMEPLRLIAIIGFFIFLVTGLMIFYILIETLIFKHTVPGWASIVLPIYFLGGIQVLSIGVVGEYIGKIYKEVKARPNFIIEDEICLDYSEKRYIW